jgi:hypothetical protein
MAEDFSRIHDFDRMTDDEIYDLVVQQLREYPEVDVDDVEVQVRDGHVTLVGRVSSDREVQVARAAVVDLLGVERFSSDLVVDELRRGMAPEAADDAVTANAEVEDPLGEEAPNQSDTAQHLDEDLSSQMYGTRDVQQAVEEGATYEPPDRPVSDGYGSGERR